MLKFSSTETVQQLNLTVINNRGSRENSSETIATNVVNYFINKCLSHRFTLCSSVRIGHRKPLELGYAMSLTQQPKKEELTAGLQFVPSDAALFVYVDAEKIWENSILQSIRKADGKDFDNFLSVISAETGLGPEDLKSVVVFFPQLQNPRDLEQLGIIFTLKKAYNKEKIVKAAQKVLPPNANLKLIPLDERQALILINSSDDYAKPQPAGSAGPLSVALKNAATGKHVAVLGTTLAKLPEEIRSDDLPAQIRPFQPLLKAQTITAALDLGKTIDLDVRVKTATAGQAVDCEKALGVLLNLIQEAIGAGMKDLDPDMKDMGLKDMLAIMKAAIATAKDAKFSAQGTEVKLTASLPLDLPFVGGYLAAKKKVQESAVQAQSLNNLKQIAIAMHNYHDTFGACPPAAVCDKKGNPQLSWRVLILPFIEQDNLYRQFKLDEPWDSANNKKLLEKMPKVYAIPGKTKEGGSDTFYRVFVGKGAAFDWITGTKLTAIADGTSNTIMCVTAATAVPWTKPDELEFDPDKDMTKLLGAIVNGKVQVAMFDGSVRTFSKIPDKMTLNALITRDGGEVIPEIPDNTLELELSRPSRLSGADRLQ